MEGWTNIAKSATSSGGSAPTASTAQKKPFDSDLRGMQKDKLLETLITLVAQLSLKNAQESRATQGVIFTTILLPTSDAIITDGLQARKDFIDEHQRLIKERNMKAAEEMGLPHARVWREFVKHLKNSEGVEESRREMFKKHEEEMTSPQILAANVLHVSIEKSWDKNKKKVRLAMLPEKRSLLEATIIELTKRGGQKKEGAPPPAALERNIQQVLDQLQR